MEAEDHTKKYVTSSLVVWLDEVKYVWNPARPKTLQTLKKQTIATMTLVGDSLTASRKTLLSLVTTNQGLKWRAYLTWADSYLIPGV